MCVLWVITPVAAEWILKCLSFCSFETPYVWLHPALYWIITVDPIFPALSGWWLTLRPQRWLRCESQKMTCPCESHDSPLPVPWNYDSRTKTVTWDMCQHVHLMKLTWWWKWIQFLRWTVSHQHLSYLAVTCKVALQTKKQTFADNLSQVIISVSQDWLKVNSIR